MREITSDQFDKTIEEFKAILVANIQSPSDRLVVVSNYVKYHLGKPYILLSILIQDHVKITLTVSFDEQYLVPVCNFRMFMVDPERETAINKLEPSNSCKPDRVVLDNHHLLNTPWFCIHPCESREVVSAFLEAESELFSEPRSDLRYLVCWFGLYGIPAVFPNIQLRASKVS